MTSERRGQLIVATLLLAMLFVLGGTFGTTGVFFTPLLKYLGVSRAKLSVLTVVAMAGGAIVSPLVGWSLDWIESRWLVGIGAVMAAVAMLISSQAHSFATLVYASALLSLGLTAATTVPAGTVLANWFRERRGLAMGIAWTGMPVGAALMLQVCSYTIIHASWRWAYIVLGIPMLLVVAPLGFIFLRTRPVQEGPAADPAPRLSLRQSANALPGVQVEEGVRGRSFWLLGYMCFAYAFSASAVTLHVVPHLITLGVTPARAAMVLSGAFTVDAICKPFFGALADRIGSRHTLAMVHFAMGLGCLSLVYISGPLSMVVFMVVYGIGVGAPVALTPMLGADIFGLKRYGALWGLIGVFTTLAHVAGPIGAGRMFDVYRNYRPAFFLCFALLMAAAAAPYACVSFVEAAAVSEPEKVTAAQAS
jgi:MFS family permease